MALLRIRRLILTGISAVSWAGCGSASNAQTAPAAVTAPPWTPPIALDGMPANQSMRWPVLTAFRDTVYIASNLYPLKGTAVGERTVSLNRIPGGVMPVPAGDFQFVYPKIIAAPNGDIHMVWAEFDSARHDVLFWSIGRQTSLWHSVFTRTGWSTPNEIFRAAVMQWKKDSGRLGIDGSGALHAVVWAWVGQYSGVVHIVCDGTECRSAQLPYQSTSAATAIQVTGESVLIAFREAHFRMDANTTGVTVLRSTDRGRHWGRPVVVWPLGSRGASHPEFIRTDEGTFLVWSENAPRIFGIDTLRVVRLDKALQPKIVAAIPLPPGSSTFTVASEPCGDLSFLVVTLSFSPQTFEVSIDRRGVVTQRHLLPEKALAMGAGVGATSRGFVAALVTSPSAGTPGRAVVMSRPACQTR